MGLFFKSKEEKEFDNHLNLYNNGLKLYQTRMEQLMDDVRNEKSCKIKEVCLTLEVGAITMGHGFFVLEDPKKVMVHFYNDAKRIAEIFVDDAIDDKAITLMMSYIAAAKEMDRDLAEALDKDLGNSIEDIAPTVLEKMKKQAVESQVNPFGLHQSSSQRDAIEAAVSGTPKDQAERTPIGFKNYN